MVKDPSSVAAMPMRPAIRAFTLAVDHVQLAMTMAVGGSVAGRLRGGGQPRGTFGMSTGAQSVLTPAGGGWERLCALVGIGEGDLEGPLVGAAHDLQFEDAAVRRREGVEQVIGCSEWPARGRHDQIA